MYGCVKVTGLMSQGRGEGNEWVTAFLVSYSLDAYHWLYVTDQYGNQRVTSSFLAAHFTAIQRKTVIFANVFLVELFVNCRGECYRTGRCATM